MGLPFSELAKSRQGPARRLCIQTVTLVTTHRANAPQKTAANPLPQPCTQLGNVLQLLFREGWKP